MENQQLKVSTNLSKVLTIHVIKRKLFKDVTPRIPSDLFDLALRRLIISTGTGGKLNT